MSQMLQNDEVTMLKILTMIRNNTEKHSCNWQLLFHLAVLCFQPHLKLKESKLVVDFIQIQAQQLLIKAV